MASNDDHSIDLSGEFASELASELAGEYVLGTLDAAERVAVEVRLQREPALAEAVLEWQEKLAPLDETITPIEPPTGQLGRIFASIDSQIGEPQNGTKIIELRSQVSRWRFASIATGAIAAALALFMVFGTIPSTPGSGSPQMVALLESKDNTLAYVASIDTRSGKVSLKRLGVGAGPGKSHELWAIGGGRTKPQSLGVINASAEIPISKIGPATPEYIKNITLAVSLEPEGGSPTGQPTGPVLFTGKCVELPEA